MGPFSGVACGFVRPRSTLNPSLVFTGSFCVFFTDNINWRTKLMKKWFFDADYLQTCNCDYGCPCEFSAPPSRGFCEGLCVWRIERGEHDGVALDGLGLGLAVKWPGAIHEGNGTALVFVEEKASAEQR